MNTKPFMEIGSTPLWLEKNGFQIFCTDLKNMRCAFSKDKF